MADGATGQPQVCEILPMEEDGDVTVASVCDVTPERDTRGGEEESATKAKKTRSLWARYSRHVPVTLCVFSVTSLIIIIALSAHLSSVTQQYDETSIILAKLQQEREHLSSSLTFQPGEALRQTNEELEITKSDQLRSPEEQKTIGPNLERTMQEEVETGSSMTKLEDQLCNTGDKLQEKTNERTRQQLKINVNSPSKKETKVLGTRRILQQIQSQLQESQRNAQGQLEMLNNMEERLSELEDNLRKLEDKLSELEERQCNQVESLGDDVRGSELHSGPVCPGGWRQIDATCYYFSSERKVRIKADEDCARRNATLAKIQERDSVLKAMVVEDGRSFWIGLRRVNNAWKWSDESLQEKFKFKRHDWCAKASPELESQPCATPLPWICQKKSRKYRGMEKTTAD